MKARVSFLLLPVLALLTHAAAQNITPVSEARLKQLLPATVFVDGENVPTEERNAAMVQMSNGKVLLVSLIDTAGYSSAYQDKYTGVLLAQTQFNLGGASLLNANAYALGRSKNGDAVTLRVYNLGGGQLAEILMQKQENFRPVKPLQIIVTDDGSARLYLGPYYVSLSEH